MTRYLSPCRKYWVMADEAGNYNLGITEEGLGMLGEITNFVPKIKKGSVITVGRPLFAVETNKCLQTLKSVVAGQVSYVATELERDPTTITTGTILASFKGIKEHNLTRVW